MTIRPLVATTLLTGGLLLSGQSGQWDPQGTTDIFVCGEDEKGPSLSVHWSTVVLAGDGRLETPCTAPAHGADHREIREAALIGEARFAADGELRWRAAQAQARNSAQPALFPIVDEPYPPPVRSLEFVLSQFDGLGGFVTVPTVFPPCLGEGQLHVSSGVQTWQAGRLFRMIDESWGFAVRTRADVPAARASVTPAIRRRIALEGAYAVGTLLARPGLPPNVARAATQDLRTCLNRRPPPAPEVEQLLLEAIGLARYGSDADVTAAEEFLVQQSQQSASRLSGAVAGLETLFRHHPNHRIGEAARRKLRALLVHGVRASQPGEFDTDARIRRLAFLALEQARDIDRSALVVAAADGDWQVRRLAARNVNLADAEQSSLATTLAADTMFQVRLELLGPLSRHALATSQCAPVVASFRDPSPFVVLHAMDVLPSSCSDMDEASAALASLADGLASATDTDWHVPARAFTTLARIKPAEARSRLDVAVKHGVWQVRAAAARVLSDLADEHVAAELARDAEPNVRSAALEALARIGSAAVVSEAIEALTHGRDVQLIRSAARSLSNLRVPESARENVLNALFAALARLTAEASDTARDARIAIIDRLPGLLAGRLNEFAPYLGDYDEQVREAAVKTWGTFAELVPRVEQRRRYPFQPPATALLSLPTEAVVQLEGGAVTLRLLPDVAPVTVARFAALASQGYYDGLTFHRVLPNFVVQGGSPGANDYAGVRRFLRDEVGPQARHVRGAVGMSKRGADTGDGQFFIDLVDLPHLDRDYTAFAYVTHGMDVVDRILEGTKIVKVLVR